MRVMLSRDRSSRALLTSLVLVCLVAVGANQRALALVFPKLVRGSLIALALIMLVQGCALASAAYIARSYFGEQLHPQLILAGFVHCLCAQH